MSDYAWPEDFWPHQLFACKEIFRLIESGIRRLVLTSPTGMGKSRVMVELIRQAGSHYQRSALYTHRRMLFDQTSRVLDSHGIEYGLRAAGHDPALLRDVQLIMTQSEVSAVFKKKRRELHPANLVLVDELHAQGGEMLPAILRQHYEMGGAVVGVSATPLDLEGEWDRLVVAGTTSQGRKCGALLPAVCFCPDEPDMRHIKRYNVGTDLTDKENRQVMMRPGVFGRVYEHWKTLNPERKPTILFAPDVAGSIFFAEEFYKMDVRAAHIDSKQIWINGEYIESSDENRQRLLKMTETGEVEVICNRFVLREGIDLPHIAHAIFACVFGSLKTYLQAGGRTLRNHPSIEEVVIQDHGANYRRHGSLNSDRKWFLGQSGYKETCLRQENMRENHEAEPITCPKCGMMRLSGPVCIKCGYAARKRSRVVVQIDGTLRMVDGATYRKRITKEFPDTARKWSDMYHRARSPKWDASFSQAMALFYRENRYYPPQTIPLMPTNVYDRVEKVRDVPRERLT